MTVVERVRADISGLVYRETPRGQLVSSSRLRDLIDALITAARAEGALKPGEVPAVAAVDPSVAQLRADLGMAASALDTAARAIKVMATDTGSVEASALADLFFSEAAGFKKMAAGA